MLRVKKQKKENNHAMYLPGVVRGIYPAGDSNGAMQTRFDESQGDCEDANMDLGDMLGEQEKMGDIDLNWSCCCLN